MEKCLIKRGIAEFFGTFVLVLIAVGTAVGSAFFLYGQTGPVDLISTALAFGLVIVAMAFTIGRVSGCHINPAVSIGALMAKRMNVKEFLVYIGAQFLGAIAGAALLFGLATMFIPASGYSFMEVTGVWGTNGGGLNYAGNFFAGGVIGSLLLEIFLTFVFVFVILTVTDKKGNPKTAGLIIGLTLTLVHLVGINFTGTSVNPARSFGPALMRLAFGGGSYAMQEIWIFIIAPLIGGVLAALAYGFFFGKKQAAGEEVATTETETQEQAAIEEAE